MKTKCCNHLCPCSVYFHTLLLISYLSAIETFTGRREMNIIGSSSFGFAQNTIHDFPHTVLNSQWHCLRQMPQKCSGIFYPSRQITGSDGCGYTVANS